MTNDPTLTNPEHYRVVFENERVRVLEYSDAPGDRTALHQHPDSVMVTLSSFGRRLHREDQHRDVAMDAGAVVWLPAQQHAGENIGQTPTHAIFVELKDGPGPTPAGERGLDPLGPR